MEKPDKRKKQMGARKLLSTKAGTVTSFPSNATASSVILTSSPVNQKFN